MARRIAAGLVLLAALGAAPAPTRANGELAMTGPPTAFERFVLSACSPCVRAAYAVATLPVAPPRLPAFPSGGLQVTARPGEIAIEVLRAHQPGRPEWASLALRVTLWVGIGTGREMYRLGTGLLDGPDVPALVLAAGDLARLATGPGSDAGPESVDADFHGGSLRVGVVRVGSEAVAYVQTGDLPTLMQRPVWEVPTTLYLALDALPALRAALARAAATIEQVRGR
jgi:hypothetical protein